MRAAAAQPLPSAPQIASIRGLPAGPGAINRFDPIDYDRIAFEGEFTIGVADWLMRHGGRHVGGGFATHDADGAPLTGLTADESGPFTHRRGDDGTPVPWDWQESGVAELNCFLCHLPEPDDAADLLEVLELCALCEVLF